MNSIELLKQELGYQKELIEQAGGTVSVANEHPSPSEITEGIRSLSSIDLTVATATPEDVLMGKTFFAGTSEMKVGTSIANPNTINYMFMYKFKEKQTEDTIYYSMSTSQTFVGKYKFYQNHNPISFTFGENLVNIEEYAFYESKNFIFTNFSELTKLKTLGIYCFTYSVAQGLDFSNLPDSLTAIGTAAFAYVVPDSLNYRLPPKINNMGQMVFKQTSRFQAGSLDLSVFTYNSLPSYTFQNVVFNCDLVLPPSVKTIGAYCNYGGSFNNITIPSTVTTLQNDCFNMASTSAVSNSNLRTVVFEKETPPTINARVFSTQAVENGFKIYVPDNSLEAYKAVANLQTFVNNIYPMSEKE